MIAGCVSERAPMPRPRRERIGRQHGNTGIDFDQ